MRLRLMLAFIFATNIAVGCSSHRTVTDEQVAYDQRTGRPVTVERETTTESGTEDEGALSGTVNAVGEVISLPFRAVGGLLRAIF